MPALPVTHPLQSTLGRAAIAPALDVTVPSIVRVLPFV